MINTKVADDQKNNEKKKGNDNDDDVKEWERCTGCRATAVSASICKSHSTASCTEANYSATQLNSAAHHFKSKQCVVLHCDSRAGCGPLDLAFEAWGQK